MREFEDAEFCDWGISLNDRAFGVDGDAAATGFEGERAAIAHYGEALFGDDRAIGAEFEATVAGVTDGAVGSLDLKEAFSLDGEVEFAASGAKFAGFHADFGDGGGHDT